MREINFIEIALRLLAAMLTGFLVGGQRERSARPAGVRTHMLVSLGACVVTITGILLFEQTLAAFGSAPDPGRLSAQVISGVGFLGAGTIIKEGFSVRGLTTAASLWAVACVGIAAGMGYYVLTLLGGAAIFFTLAAFSRIQRAVRYGKQAELNLQLECTQMGEVMIALNRLCDELGIALHDLSFTRAPHGSYLVGMRVLLPGRAQAAARQRFLQETASLPGVLSLQDQEAGT